MTFYICGIFLQITVPVKHKYLYFFPKDKIQKNKLGVIFLNLIIKMAPLIIK